MATLTIPAAPRSSGVTVLPPSGGVTIPANARSASVVYTMPNNAQRASTSARLDFSIDISTNAGATWEAYLNAGWVGGSGLTGKGSTVLNPPPGATLAGEFFGAYAGHLVRLTNRLATPMTVGLTITVT